MELVKPNSIINSIRTLPQKNSNLLKYEEYKYLQPIQVDNNLSLFEKKKNITTYLDYIKSGLQLIPIVRQCPDYTAKNDFPSRVLLEMTSNCSFNCIMCPRQNLKRETKDMDSNLFKKCVNELDIKGINGLWLYNIGESILHPEFPELLQYVSSKNNLGPIWLSSNGSHLDETFSKLIINSNVKFMNLSVNAATKETFERISPGSNWKKVISNYNKFLELKSESTRRTPFSRVQIIDQKFAHHEIDEFICQYADEADIVAVNMLEGFSSDVETNLYDAQKRKRQEKKTCNRINRKDMFVFSNGETTFCDTDYNGVFSLGNVNNKCIKDIWNSEARIKIIKLNRNNELNQIKMCKNCLDYDL